VSGSDTQDIQGKVDELKSAAQSDDISRIKRAIEQVEQAFHALSQQLYAQGQPQPETPGGPATPPNGDDVIEGEVRE
jgi:molecular chaperone DnaK